MDSTRATRQSHRVTRWLGAALVLLAIPSTGRAQPLDAYAAAPRARGPVLAPVPAGLVVTAHDEARGVPVFLMGRRPASRAHRRVRDRALDHLRALAPGWGVSARDLEASLERRLERALPSGGALVIFGQRPHGVPAFETRVTLLLAADGALVAAGGQLFPIPAAATFARTHESAVARALEDRLGPGAGAGLRWSHTGPDGHQRWTLDGGGLDRPARARRIFYPLPRGLVAAHYVEVWTDGELHAYALAAVVGRLLMRRQLTVADAYEFGVYVVPARPLEHLYDSPFGDTSPDPAGVPVELPPSSFVDQVRVMVEGLNHDGVRAPDPWLPPGADATVGNNVDAYADLAEPDGLGDGDFRALTTSPGVFAHPFDPTRGPRDDDVQTQAAITHLFFVNNWLHDYWYDLGFDEVAGNAQADNLGRGGLEGDRLHAQASDYTRRNNANMSTPADGDSPRMQMFRWDGLALRSLAVGADDFPIGIASFGPIDYDVTGPLALADDGVDPRGDACSALPGPLAGAILLVDRGDCSFVSKTERAEAAGAAGVIIVNDEPGDVRINMTGEGTVGIPTVMVSADDGAMLRARLGATARLWRDVRPEVESSLDTQVVAHEWGHYLHHRLVACGSYQCGAESEGWGDFLGVMMLMRAGDDLEAPYPTGSYSNQGREAIYFGTRRVPYSVDRALNDLSFRHITNEVPLPDTHPLDETSLPNAEVHNAGEIWATMMHEAMVAMLRRSETPGAPYDFEGALRQLGRYVVTGMQLAPRAPTFTEQRDAIVAAALEHDAEDARLIAEAFARRGAGTCAVAPSRFSDDFAGVMEDFEVGARPRVAEVEVIFDGARRLCDDDAYLDVGETAWVRARVVNDGVVDLVGATLALEPNDLGATIVGDAEQTLPDVPAGGSVEVWAELAIGATDLRGGPMDVRATVTGATMCATSFATARVMVDRDPGTSLLEDFEIEPRWLNEVSLDGGTVGAWTVGPSVLGDDDWVLRGAANGAPSDTAMELPEVNVVPGIPFVVRFDHRYDFEGDEETLWDGGVIELSTDGGASWRDVSEYVDPGYTGPLGDEAENVLAHRPAYSRRNDSFPGQDVVRLDFGTALAGQRVRLRFRIGTDRAVGTPGWELDDLVLTGVDPPVFPSHVADEDDCSGAPSADAGEDVAVAAGDLVTLDGTGSSDPDGDALAFAWEVLDPVAALALSDPSSATPSFPAPAAIAARRAVRLRLRVSDGRGGSASDDVTVTFAPDAPDSIPDAGPPRPDAGPAGDGGPPDAFDAGDVAIGGGGCACEAGARPMGSSTFLAILGLVVGIGLRRRR